jgi:hypothetical protein
MKPPSKRFRPSPWTEYIVPAILLFLLLLLIATLVMILVAVWPIVRGLFV